jgi:hypothetical protein
VGIGKSPKRMPARWVVPVTGLIGILFCVCPPVVNAARSVTVSADKQSLSGDDALTLTASMSGFADGESVTVKGVFFQDGSSNYFGYTDVGGTWVKCGAATSTQRQITVGSWDGTVRIRPDFSDSGFAGEGEYRVKLGFYYQTSGGSLSPVSWSTAALPLTLNQPDPTPTPSPTPRPTPTSTPQPSPTPTVTVPPTLSPTPSGVSGPLPSVSSAPGPAERVTGAPVVLGMESVPDPTAAAAGRDAGISTTASAEFRLWRTRGISLGIAGLGFALFAAAAAVSAGRRESGGA